LTAWLVLVRGEQTLRPRDQPARRLPWRAPTAWLLILVFGLQSILFYGVVAWLPNIFVERGWTADAAGALVAVFNGVGLLTTIGLPLVADRLGARRPQLTAASVIAVASLAMLVVAPDLAFLWVAILGLALGAVFPLVLTLPLDVASDPAQVGSVAALMLLGGYVLSAVGPVLLGAARDLTGDFGASLMLLIGLAIVLALACTPLSPARLRRGVAPV
jgi:CP family cyanate transporter-like MFS transporter